MRLSAKAISTYNEVNSFAIGTGWIVRANEMVTLYFQLIDLDQGSKCPFRYMPAAGATMTVTFPSIVDANVITVGAVQVAAGDASLWKVELLATQVPASGNVVFALTEGSVTRRFSVLNLMSVEYPGNDGRC